MPATNQEHEDYFVTNGKIHPDDFDDFEVYQKRMDEWREEMEAYLMRIDANAARLKYKKINERVAQGAIRDQIKSAGFTANMEVKPCDGTLRRMDIYGDMTEDRTYVVEVKMGFNDWIGGVAQLNYYCHLLTKSGKKPTCLLLAFHCEDTQTVPDDIFWYCDEQSIVACKAEIVGEVLKSHLKMAIENDKICAEHRRNKESSKP